MLRNIMEGSLVFFSVLWIFSIIHYLPRMKAWFSSLKRQPRLKNNKCNRIALIIPARNEIKVIGELFETIKRQTYKNFDVYVLVQDYNDPTIKKAEEVKGIVHVIKNQTCKGDALDGCLKKILRDTPNEYDAYFIVDADCLLCDTTLEEMNNALASNRQIIQAKKIVKNYLYSDKKTKSLASSCNGLIWSMIDDMGNRYKSDHNITNMTIGTGIMLRSDVIKELKGWPYRQTLTEDIELMYDCVVKGFSTFYYSYALIYVEEALSLKMTNKRRARWLTGVVDSKRIYQSALKALPETKKTKKDIYFTTALSIVYFYIGTLSLFVLGNLVLGVTLFIRSNPLAILAFLYSLLGFTIIYISFLILTIFCMIVDRKNIKLSLRRKLLLLIVHPLFYMEYIPIIFRAMISKENKGWEIIERVDFAEGDRN